MQWMVRTGTDVVPVRVIRSKLLKRAGLDNIDPCRDLKLARTLEMRAVGGDESLCAIYDKKQT